MTNRVLSGVSEIASTIPFKCCLQKFHVLVTNATIMLKAAPEFLLGLGWGHMVLRNVSGHFLQNFHNPPLVSETCSFASPQ